VTYLPYNRPHMVGRELSYIEEAVAHGHLSGNGPFSDRCSSWLEQRLVGRRALLTHSCSGALEMAAILAEVEPGDEIIMPSFTFVTTANAFVLRGAVPVFVDIRPDTLNIDERLIEGAITDRTRALVAMHYAGVACEMDEIEAVARRHQLLVIEDAAHGLLSNHRGRPLGSIGDMATFSFHETKNVISGEGGALILGDPTLVERAEIVHEKGTNRRQFFRGQTDRYTWVDIGSSYLPSEITAAFLLAQLEEADAITARRIELWTLYYEAFGALEAIDRVRRPVVPEGCEHNAHLFYLLVDGPRTRDDLIAALARRDINAVFHYVPLHESPAGRRYARAHGDLDVTERASRALIRLPLWVGMQDGDVARVVAAVHEILDEGPYRNREPPAKYRAGLG
jgi:dTDP-4-amino-4,6-dideoxygalactose transaminase